MPIKCYYKPNRTKPRYFSACDAARIAKQVVDDRGLTPEQVLACIAANLGFTHISMSRQQVVQAGVNLSKSVGLVKTILTVIRKAAVLINWRWGAAKIGTALEILDKIEDALDVLEPDQEKVEDILDDSFCKCVKKTSEVTSG